MYSKRRTRLFVAGVFFLILSIAGGFCFSIQKAYRDTAVAIKNGECVQAAKYYLSGESYAEGTKNKYLYTFTVDGKTYAGLTTTKYYDDEDIYILYAKDNDGKVKVVEGVKYTIDNKEYPVAVSDDEINAKNTNPNMALTYAVFGFALLALAYAAYILVWIMRYKNLENTGTLNYGLFVEASASKAGSNRHMSVTYKFKDEFDEWHTHTSPYVYNIIDIEKLMALETFRIKVKGKRSMIIEELRRVTLQ